MANPSEIPGNGGLSQLPASLHNIANPGRLRQLRASVRPTDAPLEHAPSLEVEHVELVGDSPTARIVDMLLSLERDLTRVDVLGGGKTDAIPTGDSFDFIRAARARRTKHIGVLSLAGLFLFVSMGVGISLTQANASGQVLSISSNCSAYIDPSLGFTEAQVTATKSDKSMLEQNIQSWEDFGIVNGDTPCDFSKSPIGTVKVLHKSGKTFIAATMVFLGAENGVAYYGIINNSQRNRHQVVQIEIPKTLVCGFTQSDADPLSATTQITTEPQLTTEFSDQEVGRANVIFLGDDPTAVGVEGQALLPLGVIFQG